MLSTPFMDYENILGVFNIRGGAGVGRFNIRGRGLAIFNLSLHDFA